MACIAAGDTTGKASATASSRRADKAAHVGGREDLAVVPTTAGSAGLTDASFILKPYFDLLGIRMGAANLGDQAFEVF
ncbi:MAG: hypothetical protein ACR2RF_22190 [Geminicoccaceae bacterium]